MAELGMDPGLDLLLEVVREGGRGIDMMIEGVGMGMTIGIGEGGTIGKGARPGGEGIGGSLLPLPAEGTGTADQEGTAEIGIGLAPHQGDTVPELEVAVVPVSAVEMVDLPLDPVFNSTTPAETPPPVVEELDDPPLPSNAVDLPLVPAQSARGHTLPGRGDHTLLDQGPDLVPHRGRSLVVLRRTRRGLTLRGRGPPRGRRVR